ncbi:MAG: helix-turn-helix domain-containing protein [Eubacteriales bacterium]|nr:helix-turn-helix domain-containing protein [Eubacteriales bacterium]
MNNVNYYEPEADVNGHLLIERYTQNGGLKPAALCHFHNSIEIAVIKKGKCRVHINANEKLMSEGEIAFIDSFSSHFYNSFDDTEMYIMVIDRQLVGDLEIDETFEAFLCDNGCAKNICDFIDSIYDFYSDNLFIRRGIPNIAVGMMKKFYQTVKRKKEKSEQIFIEVLKYIEETFKTDITLKALSKKFGYVPNYFSELFNKFTGMHLREYLNRRRISEACSIKKQNPCLSLSKIAYECGFSSENTFYRAYRAYRNS